MKAAAKKRHRLGSGGVAAAFVWLALAACSPRHDEPVAATVSANASVSSVQEEKPKCTNAPRTDENGKRSRCKGPGAAKPAAPQAYRVVGGSGDPVDQVVCDIDQAFVLDGKLFDVEFSGGPDGTYRFARTPDIPGLHWSAGGRYHIEFPDGPGKPGTMTTEGGGTTTAGAISRETAGGEHFALTPVADCK
jgi:hypothetical protein